MVLVSKNELGDDEKYDDMLKMDGGYFPKTVFASPDGTILPHINKNSSKYAHFIMSMT